MTDTETPNLDLFPIYESEDPQPRIIQENFRLITEWAQQIGEYVQTSGGSSDVAYFPGGWR